MKIYWTTIQEMQKFNPEIFCFNLKEKGMFISAPGTLIFRSRQEAEKNIKEAQEAVEKKMMDNFNLIFGVEPEKSIKED